jgi:hypothetical protein
MSAEFDAGKKQINSVWRDGCCFSEMDTYQFIDGKPVLLRSESEEYYDEEAYRVTVEERVGGKMKVTSTTFKDMQAEKLIGEGEIEQAILRLESSLESIKGNPDRYLDAKEITALLLKSAHEVGLNR